jgi:hypothetical protein
VIDLTAVAEEEEQKKDHSTAYARRESQIDLTAQTEEEGEDEKEAQGVDGPRAEGVPVMIDLTEESSDEEEEEEEEEVRWVGQYSSTGPRASCSSAMATSPSPWRSPPASARAPTSSPLLSTPTVCFHSSNFSPIISLVNEQPISVLIISDVACVRLFCRTIVIPCFLIANY